MTVVGKFKPLSRTRPGGFFAHLYAGKRHALSGSAHSLTPGQSECLIKLCLPLNSDYTQLFPPLTQLEQLRWFSDNWLRYDIIDDLLVVSDVRMSLGPGQYSFRFVVAERIAPDSWLPVIPYRWAGGHNMALLKPVLRRIWEPVPALPLQEGCTCQMRLR